MRIAILGAPATGKSWLTQALAQHRSDLHISDAPPLLPAHAQRYDFTLLMGLDLPAAVSAAQQSTDALLRAALQQGNINYGVVYGQQEQRLRNALRLITPEPELQPRWTRTCEKCSDPDCEHRLFTALRRSQAAGPPP